MSKLVAQTIMVSICLAAAGALAYYDKSGWGWFLAIAVILLP